MSGWIERFNALADDWMGHLWRGTWQGGLALAAVWLVCRLWPKLPPLMRYGLWCGAFLKLLVAATVISSIDLPLLRSESDVAAPLPARAMRATFVHLDPGEGIYAAVVAAPRPTAAAILFALWIVGSVFMTVRLIRDRVAAAHLRRQCRPIDDGAVIDIFSELCKRFGVRRRVPLLAVDDIDSPLLVGLVRPAIVLPCEVTATAPLGRLKLMLAHELAHLRHGDLLLNLLPAVSRVVFFFHPMVWLAERQWRLAQESACDRAAVAATGCGAGEYGEMLLGVAAWPRRRGTRRASSAVITAFESRRTLERRLSAMKYFSLWSRRTPRLMVVVMALVVLTALVPWRVVAQERAARAATATPGDAAAADPAAPGAPANVKPAIAGETVGVLGVLMSATAEVKCPVDTVVREVQIKEGARVKKGDLLFQLDSRRARDAMVEAEAQLKAAEIKYKRVKALRASAAISEAEIDEAEGALEIARNAIESRRHDMDDTRIFAPFDAIVERLSVRSGQGVSRNTVLCELLDAGVPALEALVPDKYYPRLKAGNRIDATTSILPERHFAGEVTFVAPRIDAATGTIRVKATVADPKEQLKPGMQMQVTLQLAE